MLPGVVKDSATDFTIVRTGVTVGAISLFVIVQVFVEALCNTTTPWALQSPLNEAV